MLREYVSAVNEGAVPCIESALVSLKKSQQRYANETALSDYINVSIRHFAFECTCYNNVLDQFYSMIFIAKHRIMSKPTYFIV